MKIPFISTFYKDGHKLTLENAKALTRVSQKSAELEEYGIACSLNILAAEEAIKSVVILTKHYFPFVSSKDFKEVFRSHKKKHHGIMLLTFLTKYLIDNIYDKYQKDKHLFDYVEQLPEKESNQFKKKYKYFYKSIEFVKKNKTKSERFEEAIVWWNKANDDKNKGLYVDLINKKWHSPRNISKDKFLRESAYVYDLIEYIELFNNHLTPRKLMKELIKVSAGKRAN